MKNTFLGRGLDFIWNDVFGECLEVQLFGWQVFWYFFDGIRFRIRPGEVWLGSRYYILIVFCIRQEKGWLNKLIRHFSLLLHFYVLISYINIKKLNIATFRGFLNPFKDLVITLFRLKFLILEVFIESGISYKSGFNKFDDDVWL